MRRPLLLLLVVLLAACSRESSAPAAAKSIFRESPESVLKKYLEALYHGPPAKAYELVTAADRAALPLEQYEKDASMGQIFTAQATFVVKTVKVEGSVADADVDVTMPDLGVSALAIFGAIASGDKEEAQKAADLLKDAPKTTKATKFKMRLDPEGWRVDTGWAAEKQKKEQAAAAARAYLPKLEISAVAVHDGFMGPYISGELKNLGDRTLTRVEVNTFLLDQSGKPIAEDAFSPVFVTAYNEGKPLKPGYVESFRHTIDQPPAAWKRKVRLEITNVEFEGAAKK
jgi:hypothetical protein